MSRRTRPHLPGSCFHLTTRLQRGEPLFVDELRPKLVGIIRDQIKVTDVQLLAYAIMPNHLHLVVRQGVVALPRLMQPLIRRVALVVQRFHDRIGHVVERRYRDTPCSDPEHLRNAIVYTHLNPVRAGLCSDPNGYAWTSHAAWIRRTPACDGLPDPARVDWVLPLFAHETDRTREQLTSDYLAYVAWRVEVDRIRGELGSALALETRPARPGIDAGDLYWFLHLSPRQNRGENRDGGAVAQPARLDLGDIARRVVARIDAALDLETVRSRWGGPTHVRARHEVVRVGISAGYSGTQIAAYLRISPKAVARFLAADRRAMRASLPD